jgi:hypothetical protein
MQSLSENSPDMILRINLHGQIGVCKSCCCNFMNVPAFELVKKTINEIEIDTRL